MLLKIIVTLTLLAILASLAGGMLFLVKDKGQTDRTAKALTWRIALSVSLFALLMISIAAGWLKPHGIYPSSHAVTQQ
jgi:hypothetical protein